jgi:hypothetical protein
MPALPAFGEEAAVQPATAIAAVTAASAVMAVRDLMRSDVPFRCKEAQLNRTHSLNQRFL